MPGTIKLTVNSQITRDELVDSLERVIKVVGCPTCGLMGWGINFVVDPAYFIKQIRSELPKERGIVEVAAE